MPISEILVTMSYVAIAFIAVGVALSVVVWLGQRK
ncbi:hypothetical protein L3N51_00681 [Metallosphaera sp. J1]|nr:hypothetical protein [Metallosphaera javensis (ex Hofmann et al. 2022)]BCS92790.1 MAG: hypothetical protein MjAS7_1398 [Metallosphaera javensis (ex Sakai et al. 2022)]